MIMYKLVLYYGTKTINKGEYETEQEALQAGQTYANECDFKPYTINAIGKWHRRGGRGIPDYTLVIYRDWEELNEYHKRKKQQIVKG
jgi:hypothetical protein